MRPICGAITWRESPKMTSPGTATRGITHAATGLMDDTAKCGSYHSKGGSYHPLQQIWTQT
uniref:Uncharacterized protein n=1 Tax=Arundo donax TaxID=35708 RepID=A0A0A8Z329_ARUDO